MRTSSSQNITSAQPFLKQDKIEKLRKKSVECEKVSAVSILENESQDDTQLTSFPSISSQKELESLNYSTFHDEVEGRRSSPIHVRTSSPLNTASTQPSLKHDKIAAEDLWMMQYTAIHFDNKMVL